MRSRIIDNSEFELPQDRNVASEETQIVRTLAVGEAVALPHSSCGTRKHGCSVVNRIYQFGSHHQLKFSMHHAGDELFVKRTA